METIKASEYLKEMDRIEELQNEVSRILTNNQVVKFLYFDRAVKLHEEAEESMRVLFGKKLVRDNE